MGWAGRIECKDAGGRRAHRLRWNPGGDPRSGLRVAQPGPGVYGFSTGNRLEARADRSGRAHDLVHRQPGRRPALPHQPGPKSRQSKGGSPVLILTVNGRKTGQPFSAPVAYVERDGGRLVVGSAGGSPHEPQWFKNLRATDHAVVEAGDRRRDAAIRILHGAERDQASTRTSPTTPDSPPTNRKPAAPCP